LEGLLDAIGNTPLVEIREGVVPPVRLFAKLESVNPGGSIKDRPVARMLRRAVADGQFMGRRRLLDSSSGNAGIAYAMIGRALNVPVTLVVPANASKERLNRIRAHGAELVLTDPIEGYDFAIETARKLAAEEPDKYFYCDQYGNEDNWKAHYEGTGAEILEQVEAQSGGPPDCFVAGVGTGGTITGVTRRLKEANPALHVAAVIPELFPGIEGLKPLGHEGDIVPAILDEGLIDERIPITLEDAVATCRDLSATGAFVGPSSGAYVWAARQVAASGRFQRIVTILCDTGERYVSTGMWDEVHPV
jgi:cysteine synthase B